VVLPYDAYGFSTALETANLPFRIVAQAGLDASLLEHIFFGELWALLQAEFAGLLATLWRTWFAASI